MGEVTCQVPLLLNKEYDVGCVKKTPFWVSSIKWILRLVMRAIFVTWATFIFLLPLESVNELYMKVIFATNATFFGAKGSMFLIFCLPIFMIAFLAIIHLILSSEDEPYVEKTAKGPRFRLWTFPVLVDGLFGVVTAAEMIGIIVFSAYIIWALVVYSMQNINTLYSSDVHTVKEKSALMLELTGLRFGVIGLICLAFLFLPVTRGSVLLRLVDIPFEHATKYHVWLGHLTMCLFTLHGLFYLISWAMQGRLVQEITNWNSTEVINLPGVISLAAGLLMWLTSLPGVRRRNFELFFYTHQLYIIFVLFLALHVGDFIFTSAGAGIFLFMLDRFLRFFQSRRTVDILSATCFPCGTVEVVLSKPANLHYSALSWVFLQIRELSWLQWHPFSVSSSPLDGKNHLSVLIKVLGNWTEKLHGHILNLSVEHPQVESLLQHRGKITASVEGPYGHESPYHLEYRNLILVAGGIGISPFLAILSDILHRINDNKPCLPRNILLVWAVKTSDELPLLDTVNLEAICPFFSDKLELEIKTFVTRESQPSLEEGKTPNAIHPSISPALKGCPMSGLVGTGNVIWSGIYVIVSTIGLVITVAVLDIFYVIPFNVQYGWYQGLLLVGCMAASIFIFGGSVIGLWRLWEKKTSGQLESEDVKEVNTLPQSDVGLHKLSSLDTAHFANTIQYGERPNFEDIFGSYAKSWGNVDIGVIVCSPPNLQSAVAKECRRQNLKRSCGQAIFHFNSHSFDL